MKLALIGKDISHSKSPDLYREMLTDLTKYDLLDYSTSRDLPELDYLASRYDAVNITTPYKTHFVSEVEIRDDSVKTLGAINTIKFQSSGHKGSNTDLIAVRRILKDYLRVYRRIHLILLGSGVMARLTELVADELNLPLVQYSRLNGNDMNCLDFSATSSAQTIVINACSRNYVFSGKINSDHVFWDYNYNFLPHQSSLPKMVKSYHDGQTLLRFQAEAAIEFWNSK